MMHEMRPGLRWRGGGILLALLLILPTGRAEAKDPLTMALGAAGESGTIIVAPTVYVRAPLSDRHILWASQIGWTSSVGIETLVSPRATLIVEIRGTPWRANMADVAFHDGRLTEEGTFEAAQILGDVGVRFGGASGHSADLRLSVFRPFVDGLDSKTLSRWNTFHFGGRMRLRASWLRSDDPLRGRSDGLILTADVRGFGGSRPWLDARMAVLAGRRWNRFFLTGLLAGFHITRDDAFNRLPVGGSWDALGADALYGFPLGAYRLASGGLASVRVDVRLFGNLELGLRGSTLLYPDGVAYGGAVQLMFRAGGFDIHLGVGLGRPEKFKPNGYASVQALWLF